VHLLTKSLVGALVVALAVPASAVGAQSLLDRPDNISTDWIGNDGTIYFNFVHRFSVSPAPEHKVTNFPTFLTALGIASKGLIGVNYATNSDLAARYPNEYEFFGRYAPLQQEEGAPFDLGGQIDYNLAVKGVDGELSIARRDGPLRLVAVSRVIPDTPGGNDKRLAFGGGGTFRFGRFIALAGDAVSLTHREAGERLAWSAGIHIALPNTPHTLSIHVSNATTSTLQGLTRGGDVRRYGFEFTIPITMSRFLTDPTKAPVGSDIPVTPSETVGDSAAPTKPAAAAEPPTAPAGTTAPATTAPVPVTPSAPTSAPAARAATVDSTPAKPATVDSASKRETPATGTPARSVVAAKPAAAAPKVFTARMKGQSFVPTTIEVAAGTTVTWKNLDALVHTVTAVDKSFNSGMMGADATFSHTFTKPGTYAIICLAHPFMKATVVVK
jgi:plastocyanin